MGIEPSIRVAGDDALKIYSDIFLYLLKIFSSTRTAAGWYSGFLIKNSINDSGRKNGHWPESKKRESRKKVNSTVWGTGGTEMPPWQGGRYNINIVCNINKRGCNIIYSFFMDFWDLDRRGPLPNPVVLCAAFVRGRILGRGRSFTARLFGSEPFYCFVVCTLGFSICSGNMQLWEYACRPAFSHNNNKILKKKLIEVWFWSKEPRVYYPECETCDFLLIFGDTRRKAHGRVLLLLSLNKFLWGLYKVFFA